MTLTEAKDGIRADILSRGARFTFTEVQNAAIKKYGESVEGRAVWRLVDAQLQALRKKQLISTYREGRQSFWTVLPR